MTTNRAKDWIIQAKDDLAFARLALANGFFAQSCFVAQQSAEKALKALAYRRGAAVVLGHSVKRLAEDLGINGEILSAAKNLDQHYISSRYPDGVPEGAPKDYFDQQDATAAIEAAELVCARAIAELE